MGAARKRNLRDIALGLFLLCHPVPVLFHTIAVALFATLASWPHSSAILLVFVVVAHVAMQLSIAVLNDYFDRRLDAVHKPDKPIPRGLVNPREALILGVLLIAVMLLLLLPLNLLALLISLLYLLLGQAYNLGLKATPLSGIVFALAIPLIPVYAFVAVGHILPLLFWLVPVAALLGVVLNLANSLPDLEEDAIGHVRTLAVVLGVRRTLLVSLFLILLAMLLISVLTFTSLVVANNAIIVLTLLLAGILLAILYGFFGIKRLVIKRKSYFYIVVIICLLLASGWLIGVLVPNMTLNTVIQGK